MTLSLIEQLTGSTGQPKTEAGGVAQPGVFADLLLAGEDSAAAGEGDPTAETAGLLSLLLGAPQTPSPGPAGDLGSSLHPAHSQTATGTTSPATANAAAQTNPLLTAQAQADGSEPVLPQGTRTTATTAASATTTGATTAGRPGGSPEGSTGATPAIASPAPASGAKPAEASGGTTPPPSDPAPGATSATASATAPGQTGAAAAQAGAIAQDPTATAQTAGRIAVAARPASPEASTSAAKVTTETADGQDRTGGASAQTRVTVSDAAASARAAGPLTPETAAAVLSTNEQAQIAAQGNVKPGGVVGAKDTIGQVTREARSDQRSQRATANGITPSQAPSRPGGGTSRPSTAPQSNDGPPSQPAVATNAMPPAPGFELPAGARSETPGQAWLAASSTTDTASGAGSLTESQRGLWRPATPSTQVAVHIKKAIGEGKDQVTVRLEPAELGRIEVKLAASSDGTIRAAIVADRADTLDLLQTDSRALERALQDAGIKTNSDSLSFNLRGEGQNGKFAEQDTDAGSGETGDPGQSDEPASDTEPANNRSHHSGTLDISV